jgi:hypothetical protein
MNKLYINKHIKLANNKVFINGEHSFSVNGDESFSDFAKSVYKNYDIKYNKFYKMDALSKLGFLAADVLLIDFNKENILPEEISIICANSSSSIHTDNNYQKTISEIPSPSVFVYTLANIVIGEICIKNNIKGESLFFIQEDFDAKFIYDYIDILFKNNITKHCITGWIEMKINEEYQADLFLISRNFGDLELNETNLNINI